MTGSKRSLPGIKLPGYLLHKPSGRARVRIDGKDHYIGAYGSEESRREYGQLIAKYVAGLPIDPFGSSDDDDGAGTTIAELVLAYLKHAKAYYVKNGKQTDEYGCIKAAVSPLVALYGSTAVADFGPMALKAVRQSMVDSGKKCRRYINFCVGRIRRCFRWGVENELVEPAVLQKLEAVAPLLAGRTKAKDHAPRKPVPLDHIEAVKTKVPRRTRDIIDLMLLTCCRPGEIVMLTGAMLDRSKDIWTATLEDHKTIHRGKARVILFNAQAQEILKRYMGFDQSARLFPVSRTAITAAIKKACVDLGLPKFTGHWLRHTSLSRVRAEHGLDAAQAMAGHAHADITQVYAAVNFDKAMEVARKLG